MDGAVTDERQVLRRERKPDKRGARSHHQFRVVDEPLVPHSDERISERSQGPSNERFHHSHFVAALRGVLIVASACRTLEP